ncbi:MAG: transporter substrate-binding domain-containing protein [Verrucomicrobiales bacterium]
MKTFSSALLLVTFILALPTSLPAQDAQPPTEEPRPLVVGMELAYPPFEMVDERGQPAGISVEIAEALGQFLGRKVVVRNTAFDGLIPALRTGAVDVVISSMTATEERARAIDFSDPYLKTGLAILTQAGSPADNIWNFNVPEARVAVKKGTTGHVFVQQHMDKAQVLVFDRENAAILEVAQGKADAFLYDQMSILQHHLRHVDSTKMILQPFQEENWAVGIQKGNDELRLQVNAFLAEFREQGGFEKLVDKYFAEQRAIFDQHGVPFIF